MASTSASRIIAASPDRVWKLVGGFGSLPDWLPSISSSELTEGGRVRHLANPDGDSIVERLIDFDEQERRYSYTIVRSPFPAVDYLSTLRVHALSGDADSSEVQWSGRFVPRGAGDDDVVALFHGVYRDGLEALAKAFG